MQNYANQQSFADTKAANIMNLVRSTPTTQQQTTYQAAPNTMSQVAGLTATGIGAYGALKAKGGEIKEKHMASGGIASGVPAEKLPSMLKKLSDKQLAEKANPETNDPQTVAEVISEQSFRANARENVPTARFAPGGIVAFADGGNTTGFSDADIQAGTTPNQNILDKFYSQYGQGFNRVAPKSEVTQETPDTMAIAKQNKDAGLAYLEAIKGSRMDPKKQAYLQLMNLGANVGAGTSSNFLTNLAGGVQKTMPQVMEDIRGNRQAQLEEAKAGYDVSKLDSSTLMEIAKNANENKEKELDRLMRMGMSKQQAEATMYSADMQYKGVLANNASRIQAAQMAAAGRQNVDRDSPLFIKNATDNFKILANLKAKELGVQVEGLPAEEVSKLQGQAIIMTERGFDAAKNYKNNKNKGSDKGGSGEVDFNSLPK
jgi:hypothetical protein